MAWSEKLHPWFIFVVIGHLADSCPDDSWLSLNNECFKVLGSPGLYDNASSMCRETGGTLLSYESRNVLRHLNVTSSTWLRSPVKIDNVTSELYHYESRHQNSTAIQSCPSFVIDSSYMTFSCDKQSTIVCQFRRSDSANEKARGIHLKLLVALVIAGVIMLIFLTLVVYSAKRRLDMDNRQDAGSVVYGKYTYLQQTEEGKTSSIKNNSTDTEDMELVVTQNGKQSNGELGEEGVRIYHGDYDWDQHNGVLVEDSVRIKHGKYVQFSVPSTESEKK